MFHGPLPDAEPFTLLTTLLPFGAIRVKLAEAMSFRPSASVMFVMKVTFSPLRG